MLKTKNFWKSFYLSSKSLLQISTKPFPPFELATYVGKYFISELKFFTFATPQEFGK